MIVTNVRRARIAARAFELCGTRFRLHGRNPDNGLDCIGLVQQALKAADIACSAPSGYALRGGSEEEFAAAFTRAGLQQIPRNKYMETGDIVLTKPSPVQFHLAVRAKNGLVHAHAGLRRVVLEPDSERHICAALFRLTEQSTNIPISEA